MVYGDFRENSAWKMHLQVLRLRKTFGFIGGCPPPGCHVVAAFPNAKNPRRFVILKSSGPVRVVSHPKLALIRGEAGFCHSISRELSVCATEGRRRALRVRSRYPPEPGGMRWGVK